MNKTTSLIKAQIRELLPSDPSPPHNHHSWLPPLCSVHSSVSAKGSESLLSVELPAPWPASPLPSAGSSAGRKKLLMPEGLFLRRRPSSFSKHSAARGRSPFSL